MVTPLCSAGPHRICGDSRPFAQSVHKTTGHPHHHRHPRAALLLFLVLVFTACAKRYSVEGLVLRVEPEHRTVTISHREIPGYMPPMAMPFRVKDAAELKGLAPGARVQFQLEVSKRGALVRRLRAQELASDGVVQDNGRKLRLPTPPEKLAIGASVPDFLLTDQSSRPVRLADLRDQVVALNFVYTRCPLPDVCPRLSAGFARLQKRFAGRDLVLLSVTLDPQYDTPEVLADYARIWRADPARWHFLTGALDDVQRLAGRFGIVYWPEEGLLTHTSETAVIARDGKLVALIEGSSYTANQLGDLIALEMERH
jgi:protein SCO1/2